MESVKKPIAERARHQRQYDRRVKETQIQMQEGEVDKDNTLDADSVVTKSSETKSEKHVTSSRSENDTHVEDANIKPVNDKELVAKVQLIAKHNVLANEQQHTEQSKPIYDHIYWKRKSSKLSYGSNDMAHKYYLEEVKKKTQDKNTNLKPREMPSARTHHTPNACTPKLRSNNQMSRNWPASKSCDPMFVEYFNPPPCHAIIASKPIISTDTPSLTTIDQDAPSTSTSQTTQETSSPVIPLGVEEADHDIKVAHMDNNPYVDFAILEPNSEESSS
ncbi:hypothetical protein Tco_1329706 [Tanacetum coccineum]